MTLLKVPKFTVTIVDALTAPQIGQLLCKEQKQLIMVPNNSYLFITSVFATLMSGLLNIMIIIIYAGRYIIGTVVTIILTCFTMTHLQWEFF